MRLSLKIALFLIAVVSTALFGHGFFSVQREIALFTEESQMNVAPARHPRDVKADPSCRVVLLDRTHKEPIVARRTCRARPPMAGERW